MSPRGEADGPGAEPLVIRKTWVWRLIMAFVHVLYTVVWPTRVEGRGRVPRRGPVVIVANHQSFLDIPLVARAVLHRHVAFVARRSLARSAPLGWVMRKTGTILIDRDRGDRAALRRMVAHLEAGDVVAVFPEGTRSPDGGLGRPKKGALLAARLAGAPIVPCALDGSGAAWPRRARLPRPGRLTARFGPQVDPESPDALERTWGAIGAMLGQEPPAARGTERRRPVPRGGDL